MQRDDRAIQDEGVDALMDDELRSACRARGMRTPFGEGARIFMLRQLTEWLDLSLNRCGGILHNPSLPKLDSILFESVIMMLSSLITSVILPHISRHLRAHFL